MVGLPWSFAVPHVKPLEVWGLPVVADVRGVVLEGSMAAGGLVVSGRGEVLCVDVFVVVIIVTGLDVVAGRDTWEVRAVVAVLDVAEGHNVVSLVMPIGAESTSAVVRVIPPVVVVRAIQGGSGLVLPAENRGKVGESAHEEGVKFHDGHLTQPR